jgi:hypothetical protein
MQHKKEEEAGDRINVRMNVPGLSAVGLPFICEVVSCATTITTITTSTYSIPDVFSLWRQHHGILDSIHRPPIIFITNNTSSSTTATTTRQHQHQQQ